MTHEEKVMQLTEQLDALFDRIPLPPVDVVDQVAAASVEAHQMYDALVGKLGNFGGGGITERRIQVEWAARVLLALSGSSYCEHLRAGPRPATARLALHQVDCQQCLAIPASAPADEDDRCDWCGARGVKLFQPIASNLAVLLVVGDACETCIEAFHRIHGAGGIEP